MHDYLLSTDPDRSIIVVGVAVLLAAGAGWGLFRNHGLRSGWLAGAVLVAMMIGSPTQLSIAIAIGAVGYLVVTQVLARTMILFGHRTFSVMLLVAGILACGLTWIGSELLDPGMQEHLQLGPLALSLLFVPGLVANDTRRTRPRRVVWGLAAGATFVAAMTYWVRALVEGLELAMPWQLLSLVAFATIFWRQFVPTQLWRNRATASAASPPTEDAGTTPTSTTEPPSTSVAAGTIAAPETSAHHGFERWATLHRQAAEDADRWLADALGENPDAPARRNGSSSDADQDERFSERVRRAVDRVRSGQAVTSGLPVRKRTPPPRNGEFDTVATGIAAGIRRPLSLPRRDRGVALVRAKSTPVSDDAAQAARVQLDLLPQHQFSETPGAAQRAHHAAPGARDTGPRGGSDR